MTEPNATPPPAATAYLLVPMTRALLRLCAVGCLLGAALLAWTLPHAGAMALVFAGLALAAAAATRLPPSALRVALTAQLVAMVLAATAVTLSQGWSQLSPGMAISGLIVCVLCAVAGWQAGAVLAVVSALATLAAALLPPQPPADAGPPAMALVLGTRLLTLAVALACGALISRAMSRSMRQAHERGERFRRLGALAADGYWEIDATYRLRAAARNSGELRPLPREQGLGARPWELDRFSCDPETLDELLADLDARTPFRDLPVRWRSASGKARDLLASGEPRFDARGLFTGFWGVVRDVTVMRAAQAALVDLKATEARYQDLFAHTPTPLVLHREGRVLDANPAALAMFGQDDLAHMAGRDLFAFYESGDSRERARRRMEALHAQPLGAALPVTDFKLALPGRAVSVRATSVRVQAAGGPAMLAIFIDDTERLQAEQALRSSEGILQHLVATSPDLITLTDFASGRYAMVNRSFERISGWTAAEAIGRTSNELGVWGNPSSRDDFVKRVRETGVAKEIPVSFVNKQGQPVLLIVSGARFVMDQREYLVINGRDVTDKERERAELARARDAAEAASRAKSAFLANTSHELRTPLNGMIGLARMARDEPADPKRRQMLDQLVHSAQGLAEIITDILDVSKIEAGKLLLENIDFDLTAELRALRGSAEPLALERGLDLRFDIAPGLAGAVRGDPLRVRQIASNLLHNALKFTAVGSVELRAWRLAGAAQNRVRIEVEDSGPGIDAATRARLFKPFTQADESTTRRYGGTGLGLSICHELAQLMGGSVGVESPAGATGQGSLFWADLPLPVAGATAPPAPLPPPEALRGMRVLMVEDNPVNMLIAVAMLERWGVEVAQAHDGHEAVAHVQAAAAASRPFHAVLMDVQMPVMSGHDATRTLRAMPAGQALPIIALTAAALVTERDEALAAGMSDFLTKPIDADKLRATLARWCVMPA